MEKFQRGDALRGGKVQLADMPLGELASVTISRKVNRVQFYTRARPINQSKCNCSIPGNNIYLNSILTKYDGEMRLNCTHISEHVAFNGNIPAEMQSCITGA